MQNMQTKSKKYLEMKPEISYSPLHKRVFRTEEERTEDLDLIIELKSTNHTWLEITDKLNARNRDYVVTRREIRSQYHAFLKANQDMVDQELERLAILEELDEVYDLALNAFRGTLEPDEQLQTHYRDIGKGLGQEVLKRIKTTRRGKGSNGFLNTMVKVIETRAKILDLYSDLTVKVEDLPEVEPPASLQSPMSSEEQLRDMFNRLEADNRDNTY